jgi:hypothetical protein
MPPAAPPFFAIRAKIPYQFNSYSTASARAMKTTIIINLTLAGCPVPSNDNPKPFDVPAWIEEHGRLNAMRSAMAEFATRAAYNPTADPPQSAQ